MYNGIFTPLIWDISVIIYLGMFKLSCAIISGRRSLSMIEWLRLKFEPTVLRHFHDQGASPVLLIFSTMEIKVFGVF